MEMPPFVAPGPGPWEIESAHFPRPFPKFGLDGLIRGFKKGFAEGTASYGVLLSHFEIEIVNGFWYQQPAAFGAPKGAKGPPPTPILWLLTRLHPGMRRRISASRRRSRSKRWRRRSGGVGRGRQAGRGRPARGAAREVAVGARRTPS